jgi:Protein of unknown function (DUF2914)
VPGRPIRAPVQEPAMTPRPRPDFHLGFQQLRKAQPALSFFGGFLWDYLTLGRRVQAMDLWILAGYLAGAAGILWYLGHRRAMPVPAVPEAAGPETPATGLAAAWGGALALRWRESGPYLLLQFFFGGLFSALFIFYFKSSNHPMAYVWALGLGTLLVGNEYLEDRYRRFTLTWALFGVCAMLLLDFAIPHLVGSISAVWFVLGTLAGALLTHGLRHKTPGRPGRIAPVWIAAAGLLLAYALDVIPPVPLVIRDIAVGHALVKVDGKYRLREEKTPWWVFWRRVSRDVHLAPGERLYCVSAVFAPAGLTARLYHRWERYEPGRGWVTYSRIGFTLSGGRDAGYRGYSYKQNLPPGEWKVVVETENARTVAVHGFEISPEPPKADAALVDLDL